MEKYKVSFYDTSNQKLLPVISEFDFLEMIYDNEKIDLYAKAEGVKRYYMEKKAMEIGCSSCEGLQVWKKMLNGPWVRVDVVRGMEGVI